MTGPSAGEAATPTVTTIVPSSGSLQGDPAPLCGPDRISLRIFWPKPSWCISSRRILWEQKRLHPTVQSRMGSPVQTRCCAHAACDAKPLVPQCLLCCEQALQSWSFAPHFVKSMRSDHHFCSLTFAAVFHWQFYSGSCGSVRKLSQRVENSQMLAC